MTTQQTIDDILASLAHVLRQLERDARNWEAQARDWQRVADRQRAETHAAEAQRSELRDALEQATDDDAMTDIVQDALVELGVTTRLDTGESMRGFCNSVAREIIDALRLRFASARAALAAHASEEQQ